MCNYLNYDNSDNKSNTIILKRQEIIENITKYNKKLNANIYSIISAVLLLDKLISNNFKFEDFKAEYLALAILRLSIKIEEEYSNFQKIELFTDIKTNVLNNLELKIISFLNFNVKMQFPFNIYYQLIKKYSKKEAAIGDYFLLLALNSGVYLQYDKYSICFALFLLVNNLITKKINLQNIKYRHFKVMSKNIEAVQKLLLKYYYSTYSKNITNYSITTNLFTTEYENYLFRLIYNKINN